MTDILLESLNPVLARQTFPHNGRSTSARSLTDIERRRELPTNLASRGNKELERCSQPSPMISECRLSDQQLLICDQHSLRRNKRDPDPPNATSPQRSPKLG